MVFIVGGANTLDSAYDIDNGLKFNGANQSMSIAQDAGSGSNTTGTLSFWVKRSKISTEYIAYARSDNNNVFNVYFSSNHRLEIRSTQGGSAEMSYKTDMLFRDVSAWYHIVIAIDTTDGTAADRCKLFVNGSRITSFQTQTNFDQNDTIEWFQSDATFYYGGEFEDGSQGNAYAGYLAEAYLIDGQQKAPTDFGEYNDNNVWVPKKYLGTFGNNGHKLEFQQSGTSANSSGIGADTSGNDLHLTVAALGSNSPALDVPTNNFCTMIPADNMNLSNGNISGATTRTGNWDAVHGSKGVTTGNWYFECRASRTEDNFRVIVGVVGDPENWGIGFNGKGATGDPLSTFSNTYPFYGKGVWLDHWYDEDYNDSSTASVNSNNDIIQIALDMDNYKLWVGVNVQFKDNSNNNVSYADVAAGNSATVSIASAAYTGKTFFPAFWLRDDEGADDNLADINFGGAISFNISSAVNDGAGRGKFEYDVPSGFFSLCTKNLANHG